MKKFFENKPRAWFIIGVIFVVLLVLAGIIFTAFYKEKEAEIEPGLLMTLGSKKVYVEEYKDLMFGLMRYGTPEDPILDESLMDEHELLDLLTEKVIVESEASKLGISVTDDEVYEAVLKDDPKFEENKFGKEEILDYKRFIMLREKLAEHLMGRQEGKFILAREDIYYSQDSERQEKNSKKIKESQEHAKKLIEELYNGIKNNSITFEEGMEREKSDPLIGESAPSENTALHSGDYNTTHFRLRLGILSFDEAINTLSSMNVGDISEPIHLVDQDAPEGYQNIGWLILKKEVAEGEGKNYEEWLAELKESEVYAKKTYIEVSSLINNRVKTEDINE